MANSNPRQPESKSQAAVWDCGSALYDSVELTSFQRRLDSAISSRTLSMPHLSHRPLPHKIKPPAGSKLSRSFQKLLRSVFSHGKHKAANDVNVNYAGDEEKKAPAAEKETRWFVLHEEKNDVVYKEELGKNVAVPAPATSRDFGKVSPEIRRLVGKTMSERFTAVSLTNTKIISSVA